MPEAVKWYLKAAEQGYGDAQFLYRLGTFYEEGRGVERNMPEAVKWYLKAAEQQRYNAELYYKLGTFYEKGYGVEKDRDEAVNWYRKALGNTTADNKARQALKRLGHGQ